MITASVIKRLKKGLVDGKIEHIPYQCYNVDVDKLFLFLLLYYKVFQFWHIFASKNVVDTNAQS